MDVIEGATDIGGLGVFIPYSYNMQGPICLRGKHVKPGFLELRPTRAFLVDGPDSAWLGVQEAGLGGPSMA